MTIPAARYERRKMPESRDQRVYCSEQNPSEPMAGTADHVGVWVLLEYKPTWKAKALTDNSLGAPARAWLASNLERLQAAGRRPRAQLIRQPDVDSDEVRLLVGTPGRLLAFRGRGYGFLEHLHLPDVLARPEAFDKETLTEPRYFVCTNGQRDACCARHGLPSYAALRERVGHRAWQVTHLGGHRFAPNVLVLPQGGLYGRVHAARVGEFVDRVESGTLFFPLLRGRSWYAGPVQAAEALLGRSGLRLLHVEDSDRGARVTFAMAAGSREGEAGQTIETTVTQQKEGLEVQASCGDDALKRVYPYRLDRSG